MVLAAVQTVANAYSEWVALRRQPYGPAKATRRSNCIAHG